MICLHLQTRQAESSTSRRVPACGTDIALYKQLRVHLPHVLYSAAFRRAEHPRKENMSADADIVESVVRACRLWQTFDHPEEVLTLGQFVERTALSKTTCFRLLQSLIKGGMIERVGKGAYRSRVQPLANPTFKVGFAGQTTDSEFSKDVNDSVQRVAAREHIQLIAMNNRYSAKTALHNADILIKEGVNLVLEFQTYEQVAPIISSKFLEANIPVVAIEIPHPGAVFFGADNYRAGMIGGRALGRWAKENWNGRSEERRVGKVWG